MNPILVTGPVHVQSGVTLTVQAGTIVQFQAGGGAGLYVDGGLVVTGTSSQPVYFTSSLDTDTIFVHNGTATKSPTKLARVIR